MRTKRLAYWVPLGESGGLGEPRDALDTPSTAPTPGRRMLRGRAWPLAVAAAVLIFAGAIAFAVLTNRSSGSTSASESATRAGSAEKAAADKAARRKAGRATTTTKSTRTSSSPTNVAGARGSAPTTRGAAGVAGAPTTGPSAGQGQGTRSSGGSTSPVTSPDPPPAPTLDGAYSEGFRGECQVIWSHAGPDGKLWDPDDDTAGPFTINDCLSELDSSGGEAYTTIEDARAGGIDDANTAVSFLTFSQLKATNGAPFDVPF